MDELELIYDPDDVIEENGINYVPYNKEIAMMVRKIREQWKKTLDKVVKNHERQLEYKKKIMSKLGYKIPYLSIDKNDLEENKLPFSRFLFAYTGAYIISIAEKHNALYINEAAIPPLREQYLKILHSESKK